MPTSFDARSRVTAFQNARARMGRSRSPLSYWTEGAPADSSWRRETRSSRRLHEPYCRLCGNAGRRDRDGPAQRGRGEVAQGGDPQRFRVAAEYKQSV